MLTLSTLYMVAFLPQFAVVFCIFSLFVIIYSIVFMSKSHLEKLDSLRESCGFTLFMVLFILFNVYNFGWSIFFSLGGNYYGGEIF